MDFGINTFLFTSPFTNDSVSLFPKFKAWGFDSVEIAVEQLSDIDPIYIKSELDRNNLQSRVLCAVLTPDRDLRGTLAQQQTAIIYLKGLLDMMPLLGADVLMGPLYSAVGRAEAVPPDAYRQQWQTVVSHLKVLAGYAHERQLKLAIEPLNRFETDFINTVEQGLHLVNDVGSPAMGLLLDTFHMNIEEKDPAQAILKAGGHIGHFHACGCDRGTPGNDHINWPAIAQALKTVNYQGSVVIESFTQDVKVIARAAAIWRQIEPSQEDIAVKGLAFLKKVFG
jgi:D-psicose/D-tagatose/L-ribulose 3-epimerase